MFFIYRLLETGKVYTESEPFGSWDSAAREAGRRNTELLRDRIPVKYHYDIKEIEL